MSVYWSSGEGGGLGLVLGVPPGWVGERVAWTGAGPGVKGMACFHSGSLLDEFLLMSHPVAKVGFM